MKKLELKELPKEEKKPLHASFIRNKALNEIKSFVFFETELLYKLIHGDTPNYEEGEELCIEAKDLNRSVFINIIVDGAYNGTNEVIYECVDVAKIIVCLDGTIIACDDDGNENDDTELTFDEIVNIVDAIQDAYNTKVLV